MLLPVTLHKNLVKQVWYYIRTYHVHNISLISYKFIKAVDLIFFEII